MADVQLHSFERHGRSCWKVAVGKRVLIFYEEMAARTFAAQLHQRLTWLSEQAKARHNAE